MNTKEVTEVLKDPHFPDSLKSKIKLIQEIRQYAFDTLGLNSSENYTTVFNQNGKPVLWIVTACEPFELKAYEWTFPFIGSFSYKGYFDYEAALKEESRLKKEGFDTSIDEVAGWSTLGWFKDPILTSMLERNDGSLANLIIHELTHGTLYVKNNVDFNENLASFIGDKGAERFLHHKYGGKSEALKKYVRSKQYSKQYTALVLKFAASIDSLYGKIRTESIEVKRAEKRKILSEFERELKIFQDNNIPSNRKRRSPSLSQLNNTFFMDVKRYREDFGIFEREFKIKFHSDFKSYINHLKTKYPSL